MPFASDDFKGVLASGCTGRLFCPAGFSRINLAGEQLAGVVALLAGAVYPEAGLIVLAPGERHIGINAEAEQLFLAAESIRQTPPFPARRNGPPLSKSFRGFASALALLLATSVSGMWG